MKPKALRLSQAAFGVAAIFLALSHPHARAANLTWDITPGTVGAGNSAITGGAGTWDLSNGNWTVDAGVNNIAWVNNVTPDSAIFGGTAGTVSLGTGITANALTFNITGYTVSNNTLTLGGTTPTITMATGSTTIASTLDGTAGLTLVGAGKVAFTGSNTLTGDFIVSGQGHGNYGIDTSLTLNSTTGPAILSSNLYIGRATNSGHAVIDCPANNQFGANTVVSMSGSNYAYLNLQGTTQTIAGLQDFNGTNGGYRAVQSSEGGTSGASTLTINTATSTSYSFN